MSYLIHNSIFFGKNSVYTCTCRPIPVDDGCYLENLSSHWDFDNTINRPLAYEMMDDVTAALCTIALLFGPPKCPPSSSVLSRHQKTQIVISFVAKSQARSFSSD